MTKLTALEQHRSQSIENNPLITDMIGPTSPRQPPAPAMPGEPTLVKTRARKRHGRCYELALSCALNSSGWFLVHGAVVGPHWRGRMAHAWLSEPKSGLVYDPVLDLVLPWAQYAATYDAVEERRYSPYDAAHASLKANHIGPWDD